MSSDIGEEIQLALEKSELGTFFWEEVTRSYIPLPIGMISGSTVIELEKGYWVRVVNRSEPVLIANTYNSELENLGFYEKFVISGEEGNRIVGENLLPIDTIKVGLDESIIGSGHPLLVLSEIDLQSKVKVVEPFQLPYGPQPETRRHVFTVNEVISSNHPENYSMVLVLNTWEPMKTPSGEKIYVNHPFNQDEYIVAGPDMNHNYPLNPTAIQAHQCESSTIPGASELRISGLKAVEHPVTNETLYTAVQITLINEPTIPIHKPADLVLTQIARSEFEEEVVVPAP